MILLFILILVYWIFESQSEAMTWLCSWNSTYKIDPKEYHLIRLPETLAIIGMSLYIGFLLNAFLGVFMAFLMNVIGCVLYERFYCLKAYKDFTYNKTSKWLGVVHLSAWMELFIGFVTLMGLIRLWI